AARPDAAEGLPRLGQGRVAVGDEPHAAVLRAVAGEGRPPGLAQARRQHDQPGLVGRKPCSRKEPLAGSRRPSCGIDCRSAARCARCGTTIPSPSSAPKTVLFYQRPQDRLDERLLEGVTVACATTATPGSWAGKRPRPVRRPPRRRLRPGAPRAARRRHRLALHPAAPLPPQHPPRPRSHTPPPARRPPPAPPPRPEDARRGGSCPCRSRRAPREGLCAALEAAVIPAGDA